MGSFPASQNVLEPAPFAVGPLGSKLDLKALSSRHMQMIELELSGRSPSEIAEAFGTTANALQFVRKSPVYQAELSRRRQERQRVVDAAVIKGTAEAERLVQETAAEAAETLREVMRSSIDEKNRIVAAKDFLDRAGIGHATREQLPSMHINAQQVQLLVVALSEARKLRETGVEACRTQQTMEQNSAG